MEESKKHWIHHVDFSWFQQLRGESDCGSVIIVQAILEERLGDFIEGYILSSPKKTREFVEELRSGRGNPLGGFAARLDFAQKHDLLDKGLIDAFRGINKLRKGFAHYESPRVLKLEMQQIDEILRLLPTATREWVENHTSDVPASTEAREHFEVLSWCLLASLEHLIHQQSNTS
jgi:hypothetical protein